MSESSVKVGLVGCGTISGIYLQNSAKFDNLEIVACADLDVERAKAKAAEYGVPKVLTVAELLADPAIDVVLNLTIPAAHGPVALAALEAGKSVYNEKPLTISRAAGRQLLEVAAARGLRVGAAPDTFMGAGLQTCRKLV
ncbi:MAG TPA: Gfo/Idh/MocA family oxidoreductase, partial [Chloroflexia bacterium]|nr:Gfo/Idh/MocA family oxidoreductase [Chloroflexia bacterium]